MRILIIEHDTKTAQQISDRLNGAHYTIEAANSGEIGLERARVCPPHLIVLDSELPEGDGWELCVELRAELGTVPILMLTPENTVQDRIRGLNMGADDCLSKPFDAEEICARIKALLRRDKIHRTRILQVADLEIDTAARRVRRAGREICLTHREYDLIEALASRAGRVLSREFIQERIWGNEHAGFNTVNVYIGMLRKKIDTPDAARLIHTIHGAGYMIQTPVEDRQ